MRIRTIGLISTLVLGLLAGSLPAEAQQTGKVIAETDQGRGILGVIDGAKSKGVEKNKDVAWRKDLLRKIGYKL